MIILHLRKKDKNYKMSKLVQKFHFDTILSYVLVSKSNSSDTV